MKDMVLQSSARTMGLAHHTYDEGKIDLNLSWLITPNALLGKCLHSSMTYTNFVPQLYYPLILFGKLEAPPLHG